MPAPTASAPRSPAVERAASDLALYFASARYRVEVERQRASYATLQTFLRAVYEPRLIGSTYGHAAALAAS